MDTVEHPTYFTLGQAAKETGKSKSTISNAIKTGRLSCMEKTKEGYKIDPSELFRVFSRTSDKRTHLDDAQPLSEHHNTPIERAVLQAKLDAMEQALVKEQSEREREREAYQKQLVEAKEREGKYTQQIDRFTVMIEDQRQKDSKKRWWQMVG